MYLCGSGNCKLLLFMAMREVVSRKGCLYIVILIGAPAICWLRNGIITLVGS